MSEPATFKIACASCQGHIEFPKEMHGQTIACPHCGLTSVLRVLGYEPSANIKPPLIRFANKIFKVEKGVGSTLLIFLFVILCLSIVGIPIAIILLIIFKGNWARRYFCSDCGTRLADKDVKLCPSCKAVFK